MQDSTAKPVEHLSWISVLNAHDAEVSSRSVGKRFLWPLDQFKRQIHDPRSSTKASVSISLFWFCLVTAFSGFILYQHIRRPAVTNLTFAPVGTLPPLPLTVNTLCSESWACLPGAQPLPGATQLGPCRYLSPYNRTYSCPDLFGNVMDGTEPAVNTGRKLLHDHWWTWHWTTRVSQKYKSENTKCVSERIVSADAWQAEWSILELDDMTANQYFDAGLLQSLASDTNKTAEFLFNKLDVNGDGVLSGQTETQFNSDFSKIFLAMNNFGDYHEGNVSSIGGFKSPDDLTDATDTINDPTQTVEQLQRYVAGFGTNCSDCVTTVDYKEFISEYWQELKQNYTYFLNNYEAITGETMANHPWTGILRGDPLYPEVSVGIDGFPKDGDVTFFEFKEALRYALYHGTINNHTLAQTALIALGDASYPTAGQRAPLQLCSVDTVAGDDSLGGILIETDFPEGCPYGGLDCDIRLTIELGSVDESDSDASNSDTSTPMRISLDLEPGQRKAVQVGVTVIKTAGKSDRYELRAADYFYVGKNDDRRASLQVGLKPFAEVVETSRPGDFIAVFSAIGGFASLSLSLLSVSLGAVSAVLGGVAEGGGTNAFLG